MSSSPIRPPQNVNQSIKYTGSETEFSAKIVGQDVTVQCSSGKHNQGSSKVKLSDRIDYNWEICYYPGQLVAAHINGKVIAYAIKGKEGGMVRVTNQETNQRALIKIPKNDIKDVSFAFSKQQIILGFVDEEGNVLIHEIIDEINEIKYNLLIHIYHPNSLTNSGINYRIIWCPFIMSFDEEELDSTDDPEKMFVVLNGTKAEIWNAGIINAKYGSNPIKPNESYEGYVEINHSADLVDASFSSDGTAIAIACADGYVKFFQIYMIDNEKQKCLHEWIPHDGKPLSSIIFVDNLLESSSQCWKFTITGANNNSELKLWSCESWTCLQTIRFQPDPMSIIQTLFLKMCIDYTGQFLIISDMNNKVLYILQLKRDDEAREIYVTMLSQFLLPTRFLSFFIIEASSRQLPFSCANSNEDLYANDEDDYDEDSDVLSVIVKMLVIQQKKFQECNIMFQPEAILCNEASKIEKSSSILNNKEFEEKVPKLDDLQSSVTLLIQQQTNKSQLNLMTPEAFSTSEQDSRPNSVRNILNNDVNNKSIISKSTEQSTDDSVENLIDFQRPQKDNFASGGSSPSREVQEILSLNNSTYSTQDYFDNLTKIQDEQEIPQKEYEQNENLIYHQENTEMVWPKIPVVKENDLIKDDNNLRQDNKDDNNEWNKNNLQAINFRLTSLENAIREQNILIQHVQDDINSLTVSNNKSNNENNTTSYNKEEFSKELELAISKQQLHIAKMLENFINMQKNNEREHPDLILANITQILNKSLSDKIHGVIANEMKHVVVPTIRTLIDSLKHHLDVANSQKINNDIILRDNISNLFNGKALVESLSVSVVNVIAPSLEKCYRDMISTSLIPTWEKVCGNMFKQINETFTQGTKEYTVSVETYMERQRSVQEKGKDLIAQMQSVSDNMQAAADKLTNTLSTELHKQFNSSFKHMQDVLTHNMQEVITEQVNQGFKNHASVIEDSVINAVRSRAVTPSSHVDTQITLAHIDQVLAKENYDEAFQLALSAENLSYVIYLCEKVDVNTLFQGRTLQQHVLLALIQQLSMELSKNTDIKLSYIRAAFISLTPDYPNTKQFIPKVLKDLLKQLQYFMSTNPTSKYLSDAKLLKMAVEGMIDK